MGVEIALVNGILVDGRGTRQADILVRDGIIVSVGSMDPPIPGVDRKTVDLAGLTVLPGIVDPHVHLREMRDEDREDYYSGTGAAAVGGITTVLDMPNSTPKVLDASTFMARCQRVQERAYVDVGLYMWACARNLDHLMELSDLGPIAFKVFMAETGVYSPEFRDYVTDETSTLCEIMEAAAASDTLVCVHAEDGRLIRLYESRLKNVRIDVDSYLESRPQLVEDIAILTATRIAEHIGTRLHVCHVSGGRGAEIIEWAKQKGCRVTAETTIHNLLFDDSDVRRFGSMGKFSPPIRLESDRSELWRALRDGTIDTIGTDHAPQIHSKKLLSNVWDASPGSPWLDIALPTMLQQVADGKISLEQIVRVMCESPARIFGLYPKKGSLLPSADADFVVVDMEKEQVVDPKRFKSKAKYSPLSGVSLKGWPVMTFLRGELIAKDGELMAQPGTGRLIRSRDTGL